MKVLILSSSESIHTQRWVNSLVQEGVDIVLVSQHSPIGWFDPAVKYYQLKNLGELGYFFHTRAVKKIIDIERPSIIHAHFASGYGTLAKNTHKKYMLSVWGSDVYEFPEKSLLHKLLLKRVLKGASQIFSTSHCMKERTSQLTSKEIEVIPFGVVTDNFYSNVASERIVHVGLVKVMNEKYGVDVLVRAFSELVHRRGYSNVRLSIAGDGPKIDEYKKLTEELSLSDKIEFLGWIDNEKVPGFMANLDIFAIPSRWDGESFGVVAVEAGAAGLPCVVSNVGGLPEVVIDGETGTVVPKDDPDQLADAIEDLVNNKDKRISYGDAARRRVEEHYEWKLNVQLMCSFYEKSYSGDI